MRKCNIILSFLFVFCFQLNAGNRTDKQMKEAAMSVLTAKSNRAANEKELKEFLSLSKLKIYGYESGGFAVVGKEYSIMN